MAARQQPTAAAGWRLWWLGWCARGRDRAEQRRIAQRLYAEVVNQARTPRWFAELGVPDTPEGRFELIALHAALVVRRLQREGEAGERLGQALFDVMFGDVDANLRELGVGDLSVGREAKRWARHFYARLAALGPALDAGNRAALAAMLETNVYAGGPRPRPEQVAALAQYLVEANRALGATPGDALLAGEPGFPTRLPSGGRVLT